jgi:hypothetical protein
MRINGFLSAPALLLVAGLLGLTPIDRVHADELKAALHRSAASDITGTIDPHANPGSGTAPVEVTASHAQIARMRFAEARAAMDRGLLLQDAVSDADMAALDANMKGLLEELSAIERARESGLRESAKQARERANDWYQAGLKIVAPPASGITELPAPPLMRQRANDVATALDSLIQVASVGAPAASAAGLPRMHQAGSKKPAAPPAPQPISQNEASLRLMREGLPMLLPIAGNVIYSLRQKDAGSGQANSSAR